MTASDLIRLRSALPELTATELVCLNDVAGPWRTWLPWLWRLPTLPPQEAHAAIGDAVQATYSEASRLRCTAYLHCWMMARRCVQPWILYLICAAPALNRCMSLLRELESALPLCDPRAVLAWNAVKGAVHCYLLIQDPVSLNHSVAYMVTWLCRSLMAVHASEIGTQSSVLAYLRAVLQNSPLQLQEVLHDNLYSDFIPGVRRLGKSSSLQSGGTFLPTVQEAAVAFRDVGRNGRNHTFRTDGHRLAESSSAQDPRVASSAALYGNLIEAQDFPGDVRSSPLLDDERLIAKSSSQRETNVAVFLAPHENLAKLEGISRHGHYSAPCVGGHSVASLSSNQEYEFAVCPARHIGPEELQGAPLGGPSSAFLTQVLHLNESRKLPEVLLDLPEALIDAPEELQCVSWDHFMPSSGIGVPRLAESLSQQEPDFGVRAPVQAPVRAPDPVELESMSRYDLTSDFYPPVYGIAESCAQQELDAGMRALLQENAEEIPDVPGGNLASCFSVAAVCEGESWKQEPDIAKQASLHDDPEEANDPSGHDFDSGFSAVFVV
ncbi:hypothetical protein V5799_016782 [Amblyomma americanum]|uniref:Uncharacterized protein n=1 Tax=Amblyomma americanum TaxID=6943 RepID=A0AAQ4F454_AMBAM